MNKYTVIKIQFESRTIISSSSRHSKQYTTTMMTRVQYLQPNNTLNAEWFKDGDLKIILDQNENELPYITGNDELHLHPSHLKDIETIAITIL